MKVNISKYNKTNDNRRIDVEIEKFDTFSLDHTLALIILPALIQLKATKQGIPSEFSDVTGADYGSQTSFDFVKEDHNWAFDQKCKEWDLVLDKMIWSFQQIVFDDWELQYHYGSAEFDWVKSDYKYTDPNTGKDEDTFQMVDKNPEEHWVDIEGLTKHEERIKEGLELFGKYFRSLWD